MALVVLSSHTEIRAADPTLSLKQALVGFENILTVDQKRQYQASTTKPDAASVIAFVTEIDDNNKSRTRSCVAQRLCTFLEKTQQFTGVVDTFVSSNPTIAALVWGGVRTAILTASNVASYFDKLTSMMMDIGRSCPTYQQFGQLYPGCVGLQRALCDYYAVIIQLCTKVIEISRRTAFIQTLSSIINPFESEFKSFLDELDQATKDIQLQLSLASKQAHEEAKKLLEHESQENTAFRQLALKFHTETRREHAEAHNWRINRTEREAAKLKISIRNNLSTINHVKLWKQAHQQRVPSTAEWLQQEPLFRQWKDGHDTAILWCSGTMGVGKTVLMSNVVAQLHAARWTNDIISYYFCRTDDTASLQARAILGSLACQILDSQIQHAKDNDLRVLYEDSCDIDTAEVVDFLLSHLEVDKRYYLILDGLDECDGGEIQKVASSMAILCHKRVSDFKILCAGRPELENLLFRMIKPNYKISVTEKKVESDMDQYIATILRCCLEEGQLKLGDPTLIVKISEALRDGSNGMFLWTRLFIEELCAQGCDNDILRALKHLPRGLSEIFDRKLCRVRDRPTAKAARKILQFCGVVKRPLTILEYQEALSLFPGQKSLDRGNFPNDMYKVISDCCGFTFIDEEDNTVHYVHHSVKQHLFTMNSPLSSEFDIAEVARHLGFLCMTYLDFPDFKYQLAKFKEGSGVPITPVQFGTHPTIGSSSATSRIAQKLLSHYLQLQRLSARELERKAEEVLDDPESSRLESEIQKRNFQFYNYAWTYWIEHTTDLDSDTENTMWRLFCRCVEGNDIITHRPWELKQQKPGKRCDIPNIVRCLLARGHYALLLYLARHQPHILTENMKVVILWNVDIDNRYRFTELIIQQTHSSSETLSQGLFFASREGCIHSVTRLLGTTVNVNTRGSDQKVIQAATADVNAPASDSSGLTALQAAAERGHLEVVDRLLAAKADVNAPAGDTYGRTALQAAAERGHLKVIERLLAAKADVNAPASNVYGRTALQAAVEGGNTKVIERLLAAKADVNAPAGDTCGRTALQAAAERGHLEVVDRLLAAKADVNAPASRYERTALQAAADIDHLEMVERLAAKADVNAPASSHGRTALQVAAERSHLLKVVERLLAASADVNAPASRYERTALQAAADIVHLKVVERLLAAKADVNAHASSHGRTALQAAAERGHLKVVERLLAAKADVNAPASGGYGRTALQAAAERGHLKIVERLLAAKADVNAPAGDIYGQTALQAAAGRGHLEVVQRLRQSGAK